MRFATRRPLPFRPASLASALVFVLWALAACGPRTETVEILDTSAIESSKAGPLGLGSPALQPAQEEASALCQHTSSSPVEPRAGRPVAAASLLLMKRSQDQTSFTPRFFLPSFLMASNRSQVQHVVCVAERRSVVGNYVDPQGDVVKPAFRTGWDVWLVRWPDGPIAARASFEGPMPAPALRRTGVLETPVRPGRGEDLARQLERSILKLHHEGRELWTWSAASLDLVVHAYGFSPDGTRLVLVSREDQDSSWKATILSTTDGAPLRSFSGEDSAVTSIALSADNRMLGLLESVSTTGNQWIGTPRFSLWDVTDGEEVWTADDARSFALSAHGETAVLAASEVALWDVPSRTKRARFEIAPYYRAERLALSPDDRHLAVLADGLDGAAILIFEVSSGRRVATRPLDGPLGPLHHLKFIGNARVSHPSSGVLEVWDWRARTVQRFDRTFLDWSSDLRSALGGTGAVYDLEARRAISIYPFASLKLSPDGRLLVAVSEGEVKLFRLFGSG